MKTQIHCCFSESAYSCCIGCTLILLDIFGLCFIINIFAVKLEESEKQLQESAERVEQLQSKLNTQ